MKNNDNGSSAVTELIPVTNSNQLTEVKKNDKPKSKARKSQVKNPKLIIDAGSSNTKYYFDKEFGRFASQFKKFDSGSCPQNRFGVMVYGDSWYAFGDQTESYPMGQTEYGYSNDNKIRSLPVWVAASLVDQEYYLESLIRKSKDNKVITFNLDITILTLSAHRLDEIKELLKEINFTHSGRKFKAIVKNLDCLPEGFGAGKFAFDMLRPVIKGAKRRSQKLLKFSVLDLGGGTITLTPYTYKGKLTVGDQVAKSGCGLQIIREILADKAAMSGDRGNTCFFNSGLMSAIELAKLNEDSSFSCYYIDGRNEIPLGEELFATLCDWASQIKPVVSILQQAKLLTSRGHKLFLTGGGFEIPPIEKFVRDFIGNSEIVQTLPDPGQINITGMR